MIINAVNNFDRIMPQNKSTKTAPLTPFENLLEEKTRKQTAEEMFNSLFPTYQVSCKVGKCEASSADWQRNDFPSWKFFEDGTKANELDNWSASGNDVSFMDKDILNSWNSTKDRQMVLIIPEGLSKKMEADPVFAKQVLDKVYSWQTNHAELEKSLSEGYGYDGELSTFLDSYLLRLDEEGTVTDYVVTGPGYDNSAKQVESSASVKSALCKVKKITLPDQTTVEYQETSQANITDQWLYDNTLSSGLLATVPDRKKRTL